MKKGNRKKEIWDAKKHDVREGEELIHDNTAYDMLHTLTLGWPCLSFSLLPDSLGVNRKFPHTVYLVTGTQAAQADQNAVIVLKASSLRKTKNDQVDYEEEGFDDDDDDDDEDLENTDDDPILEHQAIPHKGGINRLKSNPLHPNMVAIFSEVQPYLEIVDIQGPLRSLDNPGGIAKPYLQLHKSRIHLDEGFALDWNPLEADILLAGDCSNLIYETRNIGSRFVTNQVPYKSHKASVEDIQWSPSESAVFASCSADKTIKVWDTRMQHKKAALSVEAHSSDVNVISWSGKVTYLLASGSDDASHKIWDLRNFKSDSPVADFHYHEGPIVSIEWNPHDEVQLVVAAADDKVSIWDMSLEAEEGEEVDENIPPQLFFVHQGQKELKEVHWHPQIKHALVSTASDGFNIFKGSNSEELRE